MRAAAENGCKAFTIRSYRNKQRSPLFGVIPTGAILPAEGGTSQHGELPGGPSLRLKCGSAQDDAGKFFIRRCEPSCVMPARNPARRCGGVLPFSEPHHG